jgi:hypothetical protein
MARFGWREEWLETAPFSKFFPPLAFGTPLLGASSVNFTPPSSESEKLSKLSESSLGGFSAGVFSTRGFLAFPLDLSFKGPEAFRF